jgi:hypothetical protein
MVKLWAVLPQCAQSKHTQALPLCVRGVDSRNAWPEKALVGRAQSETPRSQALVMEK